MEKFTVKLLKVHECNVCGMLFKRAGNVLNHVCKEEDIENYRCDRWYGHGKKEKLSVNNKNIVETVTYSNDAKKIEDNGYNRIDKELVEQEIKEEEKIEDKTEIVEQEIKEEEKIEDKIEIVDKIEDKIEIVEQEIKDIDNINTEEQIYVYDDNENGDNTQRECFDIWKWGEIKDGKQDGFRDDVDIQILERGKGKDRLIIKNGKVVKKPADIEIIGHKNDNGFIMKGLKISKKINNGE